jgi:hemerythrin-like domain-containing protein
MEVVTMGSIDRLHRQHAALERLLLVLERQLHAVQAANTPDYHLMRDILHYLTEYADRYHHPYEDVLYAFLAERSPVSRPAVAQRHREHMELAAQGRLCRQRVERLMDGQMLPRAAVFEPGFAYLTAYRAHLEREQREILPEALRVLRPADWLQIDTLFHWREDPLFGREVAQAYRTLYDRIEIECGPHAPLPGDDEQSCAACASG